MSRRDELWARHIAGERLGRDDLASLVEEIKRDPAFANDCAIDRKLTAALYVAGWEEHRSRDFFEAAWKKVDENDASESSPLLGEGRPLSDEAPTKVSSGVGRALEDVLGGFGLLDFVRESSGRGAAVSFAQANDLPRAAAGPPKPFVWSEDGITVRAWRKVSGPWLFQVGSAVPPKNERLLRICVGGATRIVKFERISDEEFGEIFEMDAPIDDSSDPQIELSEEKR